MIHILSLLIFICSHYSLGEGASFNRTTRQALGEYKKCLLPDSNELFQVKSCGGSSQRCNGISVPTFSVYTVTCPRNRGFAKPNTTSVEIVCHDGSWFPSLEENKCLLLCQLPVEKSLQFNCFYQGNEVSCNQPLIPQTRIEIKCKLHYKKEPGANFADRTNCKKDGELYHVLTECIPVCGKEYNNNAEHLISDGLALKYAKYPWHTALYWKGRVDGYPGFDYKCGGTLIDTDKVLTAAHCVWDMNRNIMKSANELAVACGKYHSAWQKKDPWEFKVGVKEVILGRHYNGAITKHAQDIAILVLNRAVKLSDYIMPVCLDLDHIAGGIPPHQPGHVVGWGRLNENDNEPSDILYEAKMDYLDLASCRNRFSTSTFEGFLHSDKFCALYRNGSGTQKGDSGGGLTFIHNGLHYIYGIVSIKQSKQNVFAVFTNVASHSNWMKNILNQKTSLNQCHIPEGNEIVEVMKCGNGRCTNSKIFPSSSTIKLTCPNGFRFAKPNIKFIEVACNDGTWFPDLDQYKCLNSQTSLMTTKAPPIFIVDPTPINNNNNNNNASKRKCTYPRNCNTTPAGSSRGVDWRNA